MKILLTAFKGNNNSSKILLDNISDNFDKLYLTNSFETSEKQLLKQIESNKYDLILSFGEAPLNIDEIKIETQAIRERNIKITNYDYKTIYNSLKDEYKIIISKDAGNWYCNNIYYYGLNAIDNLKLKSKMLFIHIPPINKILDIKNLCKKIEII